MKNIIRLIKNKIYDILTSLWIQKRHYKIYNFGILIIIYSITNFISPIHALSDEKETNIILKFNSHEASNQYLRSLADGCISLDNDTTFHVDAFIEPKSVYKNVISSKEKLLTPNDYLVCYDGECIKKLNFDFNKHPVKINNYTHLFLSWQSYSSAKSPEIMIETICATNNSKSDTIKLLSRTRESLHFFDPVKSINMKNAIYTKKSSRYLIKRELGLKNSGKWCYSTAKDEVILQSRVDLPLKNIQAVQIISNPKNRPRIVQFSIDADGNGLRDEYILFEQTKNSQTFKNGKSILNIDLMPAIKKLKIDPKKGVIVEPIIFIPLTIKEYMKDQPIDKVIFLGFDRSGYNDELIPNVRDDKNIHSLDIDFTDQNIEDKLLYKEIKKITVTVKMEGPQFIKLDSMYFYNTINEKIPEFLNMPEKALNMWNGKNTLKDPFEIISSFQPIFFKTFQKKSKIKNRTNEKLDLGTENIKKKQWHSTRNNIRGELFYQLSSLNNNSSINCKIKIENNNEAKIIPLLILSGSQWLDYPLEKKYNIKDVYFDESINSGIQPFQFTLFDVEKVKKPNKFDFRNCEWWIRDAEIPLKIEGKNIHINEINGKVHLFQSTNGHSKWTFNLPKNLKYIFPIELVIPGLIPQPCQLYMKINNNKTEIPHGPYTIDLNNIDFAGDEFSLVLDYFGNEPIIDFNLPKIKVVGLRQTPTEDLNKLKILVDDEEIKLNVNDFYNTDGQWINLEEVSLKKGEHRIQVTESEFFKIKTLTFESDNKYPKNDRYNNFEEDVFFSEKIVKVGILLSILIILIFLLHTKFITIIYSMLKKISSIAVVIYSRTSKKSITVFWGLFAIGCICMGVFGNINDQDENLYLTIGFFAIIMAIIYFVKIIKKRVDIILPKFSMLIYHRQGIIFYALAIVLLIATAVLIMARLTYLAEKVSISIYFLLVIGFFIDIIEFKQKNAHDIEKK